MKIEIPILRKDVEFFKTLLKLNIIDFFSIYDPGEFDNYVYCTLQHSRAE